MLWKGLVRAFFYLCWLIGKCWDNSKKNSPCIFVNSELTLYVRTLICTDVFQFLISASKVGPLSLHTPVPSTIISNQSIKKRYALINSSFYSTGRWPYQILLPSCYVNINKYSISFFAHIFNFVEMEESSHFTSTIDPNLFWVPKFFWSSPLEWTLKWIIDFINKWHIYKFCITYSKGYKTRWFSKSYFLNCALMNENDNYNAIFILCYTFPEELYFLNS